MDKSKKGSNTGSNTKTKKMVPLFQNQDQFAHLENFKSSLSPRSHAQIRQQVAEHFKKEDD